VRREIKVETFLANLPLFKGLGEESLARLASATTRRRLKRGEVLFREGEPSTGLYALIVGRLRLSARIAPHGERVTDIVAPGVTFGEAVLFLDKPYIVTATALSEALVLHIGKDGLMAELERNPRLARRVITGLAKRVEGLVRELESYALGSAADRFVAWLLRREPADAAGELSVTLPGAKSAIASRLNLSAEHLSRILRELTDAGLITVRGRIIRIADLARLRVWRSQRRGRRAQRK
jgi:CRP-like cAMP-binding protein